MRYIDVSIVKVVEDLAAGKAARKDPGAPPNNVDEAPTPQRTRTAKTGGTGAAPNGGAGAAPTGVDEAATKDGGVLATLMPNARVCMSGLDIEERHGCDAASEVCGEQRISGHGPVVPRHGW